MYNVKFPLLFNGDQFSLWERSSVNKELNLCLRLLTRGTRGTSLDPHISSLYMHTINDTHF